MRRERGRSIGHHARAAGKLRSADRLSAPCADWSCFTYASRKSRNVRKNEGVYCLLIARQRPSIREIRNELRVVEVFQCVPEGRRIAKRVADRAIGRQPRWRLALALHEDEKRDAQSTGSKNGNACSIATLPALASSRRR